MSTNFFNTINSNNPVTNNFFHPKGHGKFLTTEGMPVKNINDAMNVMFRALVNVVEKLRALNVKKKHGVEIPSENRVNRDSANNTINDMLQTGMRGLEMTRFMSGLSGNGGSLGNQSKGMLS